MPGPEMAPQGQPQAPMPEEQQGGGAAQLVQGIQAGLVQFMELLEKSGMAKPSDKQQLASIITAFRNFVMSLESGGASEQPAGSPQQSVPMEQGASKAVQSY